MAQILVRAPDGLKNDLQKEARKLGITLNAFVLQILWDWVKAQDTKEKGPA